MEKKDKFIACVAGVALSAASGAVDVELQGAISCEDTADSEIDQTTKQGTMERDRQNPLSHQSSPSCGATEQITMPAIELLKDTGITADVFESLIAWISEDELSTQADTIAEAVSSFLETTGGITRTRIIAEWTISDSPGKHILVAKILSHNFYCLGAAGAASILAADPIVEVRRAVVDTAVSRMRENPVHYRDILVSLSSDEDPSVRNAAHRAMENLYT